MFPMEVARSSTILGSGVTQGATSRCSTAFTNLENSMALGVMTARVYPGEDRRVREDQSESVRVRATDQTLQQAGVGGQVPQAVSVHHDGNLPGLGLLYDDADPAQHALVPPEAGAQDHAVQSRQPLVDLLNTVLRVWDGTQ